MQADEMDAVFAALSHEARRRILDILKKEPGCNVNRVCEFFDEMGRIAVMKHLDVLEAANLVVSRKEGRERQLYFNPVPIQMIHDRWTTEFSALWAKGLTRLKYKLERSTK
jgi:predicted transcriptional regulator